MRFLDPRLSRLLRHFDRYRAQVRRATLYSILNQILDLAPPLLIGLAVDIVVKQESSYLATWYPEPLDQLYLLGLLTLLVWGGESLFEFLYQKRWRGLAQLVQRDLRSEVYAHIHKLNSQWFNQQQTGDLLATLNDDVNQLERFFNVGANNIIQLITTTLMVSCVFFYTAASVAYWAMLPIPVIIWGSLRFQKKIGPRYLLVRKKAAEINAQLGNALRGMEVVKSFTAEARELDRLKYLSAAYVEANRSAITLSSAFTPIIRMAIVMGFLATLIYGGSLTLQGHLEVGTYSVLVFLTQRLLWPLTRLGQTVDLYQRAMASAQRAFDVLDVIPEVHSGHRVFEDETVMGNIHFRQVSFAYPHHPPIFRSLDLFCPAGRSTAIVGATGSGKSTLIKLLLGFNRPTSGDVWIDDIPISDLELSAWRKHVAVVSQQVYLFNDTLMENIRYGRLEASDEEIFQAAQLSGVSQFVEQLSNGYSTRVGEGGVLLSGGERQRVSIARALLKDPKILVLDEATSAVDAYTESKIQHALDQFCNKRTVIVIAHRLNTVKNADQIVVIDHGQIKEIGIHQELLELGGIYAQLWES